MENTKCHLVSKNQYFRIGTPWKHTGIVTKVDNTGKIYIRYKLKYAQTYFVE